MPPLHDNSDISKCQEENTLLLATCQSLPRNSLGTADPRSFSRNKRGIAGSLIWVNFDRHALLDLVYKLGGQFVANVDDICWDPHRSERLRISRCYPGQHAGPDSGQPASATIDQFSGLPVSAVSGQKEEASPWYSENP